MQQELNNMEYGQEGDDRCVAVTDLMQHTHIRCDKQRGHRGNHHSMVTSGDLHLAKDGHSIRATAWQVEWQDDTRQQRAA